MYACVDCRSPEATVLLFEPNAGESDRAWFVDSPGLADWLRAWVDGTGWYDIMDDELQMAPWDDFRIRATGEPAP